jgi:prophage DNA circulation protein
VGPVIWRRAKAKLGEIASSDEVQDRLAKMERALELAVLGERQAEVDAKTAAAVQQLVDSLADVSQACLRVGSILIVKYQDTTGPTLFVRTLCQSEIRAFERVPEIQTRPRNVLEALATAVASLPGEGQQEL